jgi:DNA (cytosine-5)-methyltransferase 1
VVVVLSIFPGVDLFGRAFEEEGFTIVRGPDLLWGGDVRRFHPPAGAFWGVAGGSPCQDFSQARRAPPTGIGRELMREFARVVSEARPEWYCLENVPRAPDLRIDGYAYQRIDVQQGWFSGVSRLRHFQFGSRDGRTLQIPRGKRVAGLEPAALAHDARGFREVCRLQGLPDGFDLPGFTAGEKVKAVGNGVPIVLGRIVARAIRRAYGLDVAGEDPMFDRSVVCARLCACGCGRRLAGRHQYDSAACRKRAERARRRDASSVPSVTRRLAQT